MFHPKIGDQLFQLLPEVYRTRDNSTEDAPGDLGRYLDACGELLDSIYYTLDQRLADSFPDVPEKGLTCQTWLLPYMAQLLDARLTSPDADGKRTEVANAILWRQSKGTFPCIEKVAEAVGRLDIEPQEGWKRVATTARIGMPLLRSEALGIPEDFDNPSYMAHPNFASRHPGLPSVTIDFRRPSHAIQVGEGKEIANREAVTKETKLKVKDIFWYQCHTHVYPCYPGTYEDVSRRTVDVRTPSWKHGHYHPKRLLLYEPIPAGFFEFGEIYPAKNMVITESTTLENAVIKGKITVKNGTLTLKRCAVREIEYSSNWQNKGAKEPIFIAEDSLIGSTTANIPGLVLMEYCTVLDNFDCNYIRASDCIFKGELNVSGKILAIIDEKGINRSNCVRFSRIPQDTFIPGMDVHPESFDTNTHEPPMFYKTMEFENNATSYHPIAFGDPGCGVLHPSTPDSIRFGAEDGGEMGAYHYKQYCLREAAILDKLKDFLPVGIEAALIPDHRLNEKPLSCEDKPGTESTE
ncbi:phage tail protein [candidate division LCP-89 bacterium B3_LCP]|uniref:Phage tail protein n=1 Tax=candidate division LCP-89 bacterium B3_LCP TaxID=2012998 RepID=A0A532UUH1_UNCL8|nr:MAG: phage tail protein [candidate division LCP-89 bacterium B3_LCP]